MSIFPLPQSVVDRVDSMCRAFLWGKKSEGRSKPLVSWQLVCSPRCEGGLGLHNLKIWNRALLCKWIWDFHSKKDSLWVRWVDHFYLRGSTIWDFSSSKQDSVLLKRLADIRDLLVSKAGSIGEAFSSMSSWISSGKISAKGAYLFLSDKGSRAPWAKFGNLLSSRGGRWLVMHDRLRTLDRASYLNLGQTCPLCGMAPESRNHLFFSCPISCYIWQEIRRWMHLPHGARSLSSIMRWMK